jgi:hypothetical protein
VTTRAVTYWTVLWAIDTFVPYKSAGMDGIFPGLLQREGRPCPYPGQDFRARLATSYIPAIWREIKVMFIPKPVTNS